MLERRWEKGCGLGGDPSVAIRLSDVKDDVERGTAVLDPFGESRLSAPKFGTWNARAGAGDARVEYWPVLVFCDEKGP